MDDGVSGDPGREVRGAAPEHRVHGRFVGQHEEHDVVGPVEDLGGVRRDLGTGGRQGFTAAGRAVPDHERCARAGEVERHGLPHDPEADETHVPHDVPPFPSGGAAGACPHRRL